MNDINKKVRVKDVPEAIRSRENFVCGELTGHTTLMGGRQTFTRELPSILADAYRADAHYPGIAYEIWSHGMPLGWVLKGGGCVMALYPLSPHLTIPQRRHWYIIAAAFRP